MALNSKCMTAFVVIREDSELILILLLLVVLQSEETSKIVTLEKIFLFHGWTMLVDHYFLLNNI